MGALPANPTIECPRSSLARSSVGKICDVWRNSHAVARPVIVMGAAHFSSTRRHFQTLAQLDGGREDVGHDVRADRERPVLGGELPVDQSAARDAEGRVSRGLRRGVQ